MKGVDGTMVTDLQLIVFMLVSCIVLGLLIRFLRVSIRKDKEKHINNLISSDLPRTAPETRHTTPEPDKDDLPDSLTRCPDCNGAVSWYATQCPHCGRPLKALKGDVGSPKPQQRNGTSAVGVFLAIVIAGLVLWYMAAPYTTPTWVQHIGGMIGALLKGEDTYRIVDWDK